MKLGAVYPQAELGGDPQALSRALDDIRGDR